MTEWVWLRVVVLVVVVGGAGVLALPWRSLQPHQILLKNLSPEKLDSILNDRLEELEHDLARTYEAELLLHEEMVASLYKHHSRRRRHATLDMLEDSAEEGTTLSVDISSVMDGTHSAKENLETVFAPANEEIITKVILNTNSTHGTETVPSATYIQDINASLATENPATDYLATQATRNAETVSIENARITQITQDAEVVTTEATKSIKTTVTSDTTSYTEAVLTTQTTQDTETVVTEIIKGTKAEVKETTQGTKPALATETILDTKTDLVAEATLGTKADDTVATKDKELPLIKQSTKTSTWNKEATEENSFSIIEEMIGANKNGFQRLPRAYTTPLPYPTPPPYPTHTPDKLWHSSLHFADELGNRDKLVIDAVRVDRQAGRVNIAAVFHLNLWNLTAIYRDEDGTAYRLMGQELRQIMVRNNWTSTISGCVCPHDPSQLCACCGVGACACPSHPDTCVPCPYAEDRNTCHPFRTQPLQVDAATGFQYFLGYFDLVQGLQRVLIVSHGSRITFYSIDNDGVEHFSPQHGLATLSFSRAVTHLGYGETYRDVNGVIEKVRFLTCFRVGDSTHQLQTLTVGPQVAFGESVSWEAKGSEMRTWQSGGRVMIGVLDYTSITVYEIKANHRNQYAVRLVQTINTTLPIIHWRTFSMGFDSFLMLVTPDLTSIYLLAGVTYQHAQDLSPSHGLTVFRAIVPISAPWWRGKAVLLTGQGRRLLAYVWNGPSHTIKLEYSTELSVPVTGWSVGLAYMDDLKRGSEFVVVQGEVGPVILTVQTRLQDLPDPVLLQTKALQEAIDALEAEFQRQTSVVEATHEHLSRSVEEDDVIVGNIVVRKGIFVNGTLNTGEIKTVEMVIEQESPGGGVSKEEYNAHVNAIAHYHSLLAALNDTVIGLHSRLNDAVPASGSRRLITGRKTMVGASLRADSITAEHITIARTLDATGKPFPLNEVLEGLVRQGDKRIIEGNKTFIQPLVVGDLMTEFLGNVPVTDLVTTDGDHTIAAATTFASPLMAQTITVAPGGTVGGIDLSEEVVPLSGNATIGGCVFREDVIVNSLTTLSKFINGVDMNRLSTSALTVNGGTVLGSLIFTNSLTVHTIDAKWIMGVNTEEFMATTVFRNRPATLQGRLVAPTVEVRGDLVVKGLINGKNFPADYPLQTDTNINFGAKRFMRVTVNILTAGPVCLVDGLPLERLVTLHTPQTITGYKTFAQGVYIEGNLEITSKILDGVNLDQLNASLHHTATTDWKFNVIFKERVTVPSLNYGGTLNGIDFVAFANDVVYDDEPIVISSNKIFKNGLTVTNATFHGTFNGASFSNIVTTDNSATRGISGSKIFSSDVTFNDLTVGSLDGVNLEDLVRSAVYLNKPGQIVYGTKTLTHTLRCKELVVTGKIGDVDFTKIVTKSTDQTFTVAQSLRSANFTDVEAIELEMPFGATVNSIDLASLYSRRISLTSPGFYTGVLTVEGSVSALDSITVGYINGRQIDLLVKDFVMRDEFSVITGDLTFTNLTVLGPITTQNMAGANGLNITDIDLHAVKVTGDQVITGSVRLGEVTFRSNVEVRGLVDGVDLLALSRDVVLKNSTEVQIITGEKRFESGITVLGDIEATTINGIDLRKHLLTSNTPQVITAPYTFVDVDVKGELVVLGLYNGINLTSLASPLLQTPVFRGDVTFHGAVSVGHLRLTDTYNGINVEARLADAIPLKGGEVVITGKKTFTADTTVFTKLNIKNLNMVPLNHFLNHVVLKDKESNITGHIKITGEVRAPLIIASSVNVQGRIGGVDYNRLVREAVYINKNHTFTTALTFSGDLLVTGELNAVTLNGVRVSDFLTTNTEQTMTSHVTLATALTNDVIVQGLVNSWRLPDEVADTMKAVGGQTLRGPVTLAGRVEVLRDVQVTGRVGTAVKVDLSSQAVSLHQPTEIQGSLAFKVPVVASTLTVLPGIVSGVNVPHLLKSVWFVDLPATISGNLIFLQPVIFKKDVELNQRNNITELIVVDQVNRTLSQYNSMNRALMEAFKSMCSRILPLYHELQNAVHDIGFFQSVQEGNFQHPHNSSATFTAFEKSFMVVSWGGSGQCQSTWFELTGTPVGLVARISGSAAQAGWGNHWLFLGESHDVAYVAVARSSNDGCGGSGSAIWKLNSKTEIKLHKNLAPGKYLSMSPASGVPGVVRLQVHSVDRATTYLFTLSSGSLQQTSSQRDTIEHSTSLLTRSHTEVTFTSSGRQGRVYVEGVAGEQVVVERSIDDCALMEGSAGRDGGAGPVLLLLSVTREDKMHDEEFIVELSLVDLANRTLTWMDLRVMMARTHLTTFHVGPALSGSWVIVAVQEGGLTVVYTLIGETLKEVAYLSTQGVTWTQHLSKPALSVISPDFTWPTHYLLLGRKSRAFVLARLVMNGSVVPRTNITSCDHRQFSNPNVESPPGTILLEY